MRRMQALNSYKSRVNHLITVDRVCAELVTHTNAVVLIFSLEFSWLH